MEGKRGLGREACGIGRRGARFACKQQAVAPLLPPRTHAIEPCRVAGGARAGGGGRGAGSLRRVRSAHRIATKRPRRALALPCIPPLPLTIVKVRVELVNHGFVLDDREQARRDGQNARRGERGRLFAGDGVLDTGDGDASRAGHSRQFSRFSREVRLRCRRDWCRWGRCGAGPQCGRGRDMRHSGVGGSRDPALPRRGGPSSARRSWHPRHRWGRRVRRCRRPAR